MSKQNGDKARFNRIRKQNTARRLKVRELREKLVDARNPSSITPEPQRTGIGAAPAKVGVPLPNPTSKQSRDALINRSQAAPPKVRQPVKTDVRGRLPHHR